MFSIAFHVIHLLDLRRVGIKQESTRTIRSHRHLSMLGRLQIGDDIAYARNRKGSSMVLQAIDKQAIVLGADEELVLPNGKTAQGCSLWHFVGDDIRAVLARLREIAVEGITTQEPDIAFCIRLDVSHTILHTHLCSTHSDDSASLFIKDMKAITIACIEFSLGSQDSLRLADFWMDLSEVSLSLTLCEDSLPCGCIDGMIFALAEFEDIRALTSRFEGDDTLAVIETDTIAGGKPHSS